MHPNDLIPRARAWAAQDPDPRSREQMLALIQNDDLDRLALCMGPRLQFGTAGLRGPLAPGPAGMNLAVVRGVTHAVAQWVTESNHSGPVVIGFDGRHGSRLFAEQAARVLASHNRQALLYNDVCPTPELAWVVYTAGCAAGIMVTASHNPPGDNGYKVFAADGAQVLPADAQRISELWSDTMHEEPPELALCVASGLVRTPDPKHGDRWLDALMRQRVHPDPVPTRIVYSAMHGVGSARVHEVLRRAGHHDVHTVPEQDKPDGDFPTVAFPNPEEPGALDLATALASQIDADIVLANDPDADRLAVAVPTPSGWRVLSGNEIGWLLAEDLLAHGPSEQPRLVATTIVSSTMLARIAAHHDAAFDQTLTGFKWLGHLGMAFEKQQGRFVLGYEEALGYCAGGVTRDKDGVSAVLLFADLAAECNKQGVTITDRLEALHRRHGLHLCKGVSSRFAGLEGPRRMAERIDRLRETGLTELDGEPVIRVVDLLRRTDTRDGIRHQATLPETNLLAFESRSSRLLIRPSGTEPKLKMYAQVIEAVDPNEPLDAAKKRAEAKIERVLDVL